METQYRIAIDDVLLYPCLFYRDTEYWVFRLRMLFPNTKIMAIPMAWFTYDERETK